MTAYPLRVKQIHAGSEVLDEVERWYSTPDVSQWMDGFKFSKYFKSKLGTSEDVGDEFRLDALAWIGFDADECPVAFVGGEIRVPRMTSTSKSHDANVSPKVQGPQTFGFIYAVAKGYRRRGYGTRTLAAVLASPSLHDVDVFSCHIDAANKASLQLIRGLDRFTETRAAGNKLHFQYERPSIRRHDR
ncbi:GNAT family N-acetyltransferase [Rhodococcus sp. NPDC057014]|uniref:GNAT family N-acetyltransferase n=1 Tax=Rhodococcus sp. NPDC057014 TaxID=3346000 RepID=UPI0036321925